MPLSENSVRINVTMSKDLAQWVEDKAKEIGANKSSLVAIAVGQYRTQVTMTELVSRIPADELKKLLAEMQNK